MHEFRYYVAGISLPFNHSFTCLHYSTQEVEHVLEPSISWYAFVVAIPFKLPVHGMFKVRSYFGMTFILLLFCGSVFYILECFNQDVYVMYPKVVLVRV